ncbi:MAG TPA: sulfotransferase [Streptosporangiaceae bacterium]|jgi:hypothetical protein
MAPRPHILVVNGRKVRQPVFVIGAPYSGADLVARALKQSAGMHLTIGQRSVVSVAYAFARSPSIQRGRSEAAATVVRDALAQAWQVSSHSCLECSAACRAAGGVDGAGTCVTEREITRYGDASPDLMYCAEILVDAFGDARLIQLVRDGRDVVAAMLADPQTAGWFRREEASLGSEFPHPFLGIETQADLAAWPKLSLAGKCAMRWRGAVRKMARLRGSMRAEQLTTLRYEEMARRPESAAGAVSAFVGDDVGPVRLAAHRRGLAGAGPGFEVGSWRRALTPAQLSDVERAAGEDLRRVGYGS